MKENKTTGQYIKISFDTLKNLRNIPKTKSILNKGINTLQQKNLKNQGLFKFLELNFFDGSRN
jgi:hypothetical protein